MDSNNTERIVPKLTVWLNTVDHNYIAMGSTAGSLLPWGL